MTNNNSRIENSVKNISYSIAGQFLGIFFSFYLRKIIIETLGLELLGITNVFNNLISILSLAELGIGTSIIFTLYGPIISNNIEMIKSLMHFFKKAYISVSFTILIIGIIILFLLEIIVPGIHLIENYHIIFMIYLLNSIISYFWSYKRVLLIAYQQKYIATLIRYLLFTGQTITQILLLLLFKDVILFSIAMVAFTFIENITISFIANQRFPYLKENIINKLKTKDKKQIYKYIYSMFLHKLGGIIVGNIDLLFISYFLGLSLVGIYSNYSLVRFYIFAFISVFFQSILPSLGNLTAASQKSKISIIFNLTNLFAAYTFLILFTSFILFSNPLIQIWLGSDLKLDDVFIVLFAFSILTNGLRLPLLTMRDAMGLFWIDRFKPIVEVFATVLILSLLTPLIGIYAIPASNIITNLTICLIVEPLVVLKTGMKKALFSYYKEYFMIISIAIFALLTYFLIQNFIYSIQPLLFPFFLNVLFVLFFTIFLSLFFYFYKRKSPEMIYLSNIIKIYINKFKSKKLL